jgi:hypothetical protein
MTEPDIDAIEELETDAADLESVDLNGKPA